MWITTIVAVSALVIGLLLKRFLRARLVGENAESVTVRDLISPVETLATLILAFAIVVAAESFGAAGEASRTEAGAVDHLYEVADFVEGPARERLQADTVCYARAVQFHEWPHMARSETSKVPSVWSTRLRTDLKEADKNGPTFEMIVAADDERSQARQKRVSEASATIPEVMYWFMLLALAVVIAGLAFCLPHRKQGTELACLVVLSALIAGCLMLTRDIDRPFDGLIRVDAAAMRATQTDISDDFARAYPNSPLPCDASGAKTTRPTADAS
ncbi:bestrophin-like domain [Streptomyces luteolus]|uniref:DUF4239 domain-containing protein n=1 Tax=Streptomyces luteolus TaxID=3043615 RepID=A0ABT6T3C1_9ACTN|nr:DUF4239 domain-containing protein [Streptomyces sp. B-S-A12]MDI3422135.1 DUF4239 domain-containing protein [Streptomyces sp. B-S-A12]